MSSISQPVKTIGVMVGRDLIGDALIKLPFLRALRRAFPGADIHWITTQGPTAFASLLRQATRDLIDTVDEMPGWATGTRGVDGKAPPYFDLLIDTRTRWRDALMAKKLPHALFIGAALNYLVSEQWPPLGTLLKTPAHLSDRLLRLIEIAAGYTPSTAGALMIAPALQKTARRLLPEGQIYVGLAPGAGNPVKIWPRYKFEQVASRQIAQGRVPVFLLGPQELPWFEELSAALPAAKFPLQDLDVWGATQLDVDHTLAVASLLDVAVANDSGVGHMLAAVDCPLISLFGPTAPAKLAPRVTHGKVIRAQDFGGEPAMTAIPVDAVARAITDMLPIL